MLCKAERYQLAAALSALLVGLIVYLFERPAEGIYFFAVFSYSSSQHHVLPGGIGQCLPSFVHTYAFILLTVIAAGNKRPRVLFISTLLWGGVGWLFEFAQHPAISAQLLEHIPEWFSGVPVLENCISYFQYGTFDPLDLLATVAGAFAAWLTHRITQKRSCDDETE